MTGTPLDLTPFGPLLSALGLLYWALAIALAAFALWYPKRWLLKLSLAVLVFTVFVYPVVRHAQRQQIQRDQSKGRLDAAMALFAERCKTAGKVVHKTIEGVEGVLLLNVRSRSKASDRSDPNWPDAALANERQGEEYIANFLQWEQHKDKRSPRGYLNYAPSDLPGYKYVDVKESGGLINRYVLSERGNPDSANLSKSALIGKPARYSVSFVNMIDPVDRAYWIAGTAVTITDTQTQEVLAHSTWYAMDPGQGSTAGARAPWGFAWTCPEMKGWVGAPTRMFVDQVLKPKLGE